VKRDIPLGHTNESSATTRQQTIQQRKGVNAEGEPSQRDRQRERETWKKGNTRISACGIPRREEGEPGANNKSGKKNERKQNDYKNVRNGPEVVLSSVGTIIRVERRQQYKLHSWRSKASDTCSTLLQGEVASLLKIGFWNVEDKVENKDFVYCLNEHDMCRVAGNWTGGEELRHMRDV
jgi:hypothetical protein